jgi:retron-type reverse transcriptase
MDKQFTKNINLFKELSWKNSLKSVLILQKRLFKAVYVKDLSLSFKLQKIILKSSSSRLVSIRYVTQICPNRKIAGGDGVIALTFSERFKLNEVLKNNYNSWIHESLRKLSIMNKDGSIKHLKLATISDRSWQYLIRLAIEPAHEALFHPANFGFRVQASVHSLQLFVFSNLSLNAFGFQKRLFEIDLKNVFCNLKFQYLLKKLVAPRSIKFCLSTLFSKGFDINFPENVTKEYDLSSFLANVVLSGIEDIQLCYRFGSKIVFFLKPFDNELTLFKQVKNYLLTFIPSSNYNFYIKVISSFQGIDSLGWYFKVTSFKNCLVVPSYSNYQEFLFRVKRIINNSNYGAEIKVNKLFPVVKDWVSYHKHSSLKSFRFSLFFIRKRALKVFSKESRQDFFSSKRLLDKCFYFLLPRKSSFYTMGSLSPGYGHLTFGISLLNKVNDLNFLEIVKKEKVNYFFCVHCGVDYGKNN